MSYISFQPSDYFNTKLYTGNATDDTAITGVGFTPSFLWGKNRTDSTNHYLIDAVRGITKNIKSQSSAGEATDTAVLKSFDSDGFTLGDGSLNQSAKNFVTWNWKANGQGSSNTDGSINTTYTSANTTSGFSIVTYTSGGGSGTVGHGLGSVPKVMFYKPLSTSGGWDVYHHSLGISKRLNLHNTAAESSGYFQTLPTSSVFTEPNLYSGASVIMYCFAEKKGFSKFGSYTGNGNADGPFIYTGFKPAMVILKRSSTAGNNWNMVDNKRNTFNVINNVLAPSSSDAEVQANVVDFTSSGFKLRISSSGWNHSGDTFIFMAFAEAPLVSSNGVPAVAR